MPRAIYPSRPGTLRALARQHGKNLGQLGLSNAYASQLNTGLERAGAQAIATIAETLCVEPSVVSGILDAAYRARRRASPEGV